MLARPGTGTSTMCSRDSLVVGLAPLPSRGSTSGAGPAYTATTWARVSGRASRWFAAARVCSMSSSVGAGSARSPAKSVAVVPTIQCCPQGMKNSTLFSLRRIIPVSASTALRGTTMLHALGHPDPVAGPYAGQLVHQVGPHPGADHHGLGRHFQRAAGLLVAAPSAGRPPPSG